MLVKTLWRPLFISTKVKNAHILGPATLLLILFPKDKRVYVQSDLCKRIIFGTYFVIANVWKQLTCLLLVG